MTKIIGISGKKQAGKNTVANCITGNILLSKQMIQDYSVDDNGSLIISTLDSDNNSGYGIFDVTRKDSDFVNYAERELWPYTKIYHFADPLKDMAVNLFGLNSDHVYGNNDEKNLPTHLLWKDIPLSESQEGSPTVREFLEHFGTKIVRKIYNNAWSEYTIKKIIKEQSAVAIIPDVRFPNEVDAIKNNGGIVIRLSRNIYDSNAEAECALDNDKFDWKKFDIIIDNTNIEISDLMKTISNFNNLWNI